MKLALQIIAGLIIAFIVLLAVRSWLSRSNPPELGLQDGALRACSERPNCVLSTASGEHAIAPIAYPGDRAETERKLRAALALLDRIQFVSESGNYWHVTQTSALFRFIDDIEFQFDDAAAQIQVRSASRVGYSDMGVNRARIESLRAALNR
jgi:uncharacterized protein (DUF1499 family)